MYEAPDGRLWRSRTDYVAHEAAIDRARLRVEFETWPVIEGFTRYVISESGRVVNRSRATEITPSVTNGRVRVSLVGDDGTQRTLSLSRLVAHHFLAPPADEHITYYDIRPKDGNAMNVHVSNLEWFPRWKRYANPENYDLDIS